MPNLSQEVGSVRGANRIKKFRPDSKWDFNDKANNPEMCRFCGQPMFVYKEQGNFVWHSCSTHFCQGNKDTIRMDVPNHQFISAMNNIGDRDKLWSDFKPRQVI